MSTWQIFYLFICVFSTIKGDYLGDFWKAHQIWFFLVSLILQLVFKWEEKEKHKRNRKQTTDFFYYLYKTTNFQHSCKYESFKKLLGSIYLFINCKISHPCKTRHDFILYLKKQDFPSLLPIEETGWACILVSYEVAMSFGDNHHVDLGSNSPSSLPFFIFGPNPIMLQIHSTYHGHKHGFMLKSSRLFLFCRALQNSSRNIPCFYIEQPLPVFDQNHQLTNSTP